MQNELIQIAYHNTTITYFEGDNLWKFTLRGRDRSAPSLAAAKEAVDKPVAEKAKPFEKIAAWEITYGDSPYRVQVTGIAESSWRSNELLVWIKASDGHRRKQEAAFRIYPSVPANDLLANAMIEKYKQIASIKEEIDKLRTQLAPLTLEIPA